MCTAQRFSAQRAAYERAPCTVCILDRCHLFSLNVCSHFHFMCACVSEKRASSLGLITLTHFVVFAAARLQSQIAARLLDVFLIRLHRHGTWGVDYFPYYYSFSAKTPLSSAILNQDETAVSEQTVTPSQFVRGFLLPTSPVNKPQEAHVRNHPL